MDLGRWYYKRWEIRGSRLGDRLFYIYKNVILTYPTDIRNWKLQEKNDNVKY